MKSQLQTFFDHFFCMVYLVRLIKAGILRDNPFLYVSLQFNRYIMSHILPVLLFFNLVIPDSSAYVPPSVRTSFPDGHNWHTDKSKYRHVE